jgi:uncharacterized protein YecE (DUF72 family)
MLAALSTTRVTADPAVVPRAAEPGGWSGFRYYRLHKSPRMYYSAYSREALNALAQRLTDDHARRCASSTTPPKAQPRMMQ